MKFIANNLLKAHKISTSHIYSKNVTTVTLARAVINLQRYYFLYRPMQWNSSKLKILLYRGRKKIKVINVVFHDLPGRSVGIISLQNSVDVHTHLPSKISLTHAEFQFPISKEAYGGA